MLLLTRDQNFSIMNYTLMKTEKIVLSFIAVLVGLLVAGVAFYFYQSTKVISPNATKKETLVKLSPTKQPTTTASLLLSLDQPVDETVTNKKTIVISGKTLPDATITVTTPIADQVVKPSSVGDFSTTITIDDGENPIYVIATLPNGEETTKTFTVTYNTENF